MITILHMLLISIIVCFIIDCSGFIHSMKELILNKGFKLKTTDANALRLRPFDCSLCMTFWTNIIYLFITNSFSLANLTIVCLLALFASNISGLLMTLKDYLAKLESWLQKQLY